MGEDDEGEVGEEEAGYVGDAQVGTGVETEGPRTWVEEMAEMILVEGVIASFMKSRDIVIDNYKLSRQTSRDKRFSGCIASNSKRMA